MEMNHLPRVLDHELPEGQIVERPHGIERRADEAHADANRLARSADAVRRHLDGKEIVKQVVVPGKLVNLVVR